jgi:2-desacetyl-2-hydroxyethyl bacteriochlorophyllide A dehydrogenase
MKALVLETPGRLALADTAHPGLPGKGQALVRIRRAGVCGTDIHSFHGRQPFFTYPRILGHELGVEVVAVGAGVTTVAVGDRCAVEPYLNCGRCIACRRHKPNCCAALQVLGVHVDGGYREEILIPAGKLHRSSKLGFDQLALVETLGIGAHAVERAHLEPGEVVAIVGAGPIGLSALQFALAAKARVIVIDINETRLAFCRDRLGIAAADLIDSRSLDVVAQLRDLTGGDLPTAVFDATGNPKSMAAAFNYPAHGGRLVFIGLFPGDVSFHDPQFHKRELTLLASRNARPADFSRIIGLVESGQVDTAPWITHHARIENIPAVFDSWTKPEAGVLKAMIEI